MESCGALSRQKRVQYSTLVVGSGAHVWLTLPLSLQCCKDEERKVQTSEMFVERAMIHLLLACLGPKTELIPKHALTRRPGRDDAH